MKKAFLGIFILLLLASCFKKNKFPSAPKISFDSFEITGDSARLVFSFEDGEGDIGLEDNQISAPYDLNSFYYYNLYLVYYEKKDVGGWQPGTDLAGDSIVFANRLRPIYTGKKKSISGTIDYTIEPIFYNLVSPDSDTIKYRILLIDRALNKSNWIETQEIVK
jgi:hypothetical protein